ncbi:MAG: pyridoxal phosphate-dependent aminotransferase [Deltaproteobacteria bacterium]|nr:pyridoxal phosphate-dependent aminotransferase [Candidatus Zymogenaceae bacterium]
MKRKLSDRVLGLAPSPTLAISAQAKEMRARGEDVIGFGVGEPDFQTPEHIKEAGIQAILDGKTGYTDASGIIELKKVVSETIQRETGADYPPESVIINCGGKHSFFNLALAFFEPGDEVLVPAPYWVSYPPMVSLAGAAPVIIPASKEEGFKVTVDTLSGAVTKRTKALVLNSPSNPTGAAYTGKELEGVARFCLENDIYIISDEIYDKLVYDGFTHVSVASLGKDVADMTIYLNGVSKTYAMTGWRIGYAAGPADLIKAMGKVQSQSTSNPTSISQWAAIDALTGPQDDVEKMRREFERRRSIMVDSLNEIPGVSCLKPQGAFYVFPDVSGVFGASTGDGVIEGSVDFASYLLTKVKVALVPGSAFGDDRCVRLSYAASLEEITEGVRRIGEAVAALS